ncbi:MAG: hypothetical protein JXR76_03420 [Deltaproteobacteria bacterium]|nr:hypothetical protein [Deltaproteobacteria bacterium]
MNPTDPLDATAKVALLKKRYVALERRIAELWPPEFAAACASCDAICCRPHMADEVLQSPWLQDLAAAAHGANWHRHHVNPFCRALAESGCLLKAGKPPFCISFYCDRLLGTVPPLQLVANLYLSFILTELCRLDRRRNLLELDEKQMKDAVSLIEKKISHAETQLRQYVAFIAANDSQKAQMAVFMLADIPAVLSKTVRQVILENRLLP